MLRSSLSYKNEQVATSLGACPYWYERKFRTNGLIGQRRKRKKDFWAA
jgi:hypothetical protein